MSPAEPLPFRQKRTDVRHYQQEARQKVTLGRNRNDQNNSGMRTTLQYLRGRPLCLPLQKTPDVWIQRSNPL